MFCRLKYISIAAILLAFFNILPANCDLITPVDAQKNAQMHNNRGTLYMKERDYLAAIKEFKIAIAVNPRKQSTATYYNNLGCAYMEIAKIQGTHNVSKKNGDFAQYAQMSFESAITQDCMNLSYYQNLVDSFYLQGTLSKNLAKYKKSKKPFDKIIVGLIYEKLGKKSTARTLFDDFITENPDLIISKNLRLYIR